MLRYTTDRDRPGLAAFYNIQPGKGVGLFLQPRNLHGANGEDEKYLQNTNWHQLLTLILILTFNVLNPK